MQSKAATVAEYLAELPDDRRAEIEAVRRVILENLDSDFEEGMQYGMIGYYVPHRVYPKGYHCDPKQPLPFAGLASQKGHLSLYLMCVYADGEHATRFREAWASTGKKLDMGKSCIRFKRAGDLALDVIGETVRGVRAKAFVDFCEAAVQSAKQASADRKSAASRTKAAPKATGAKAGSKKAAGTGKPPASPRAKAPRKEAPRAKKSR